MKHQAAAFGLCISPTSFQATVPTPRMWFVILCLYMSFEPTFNNEVILLNQLRYSEKENENQYDTNNSCYGSVCNATYKLKHIAKTSVLFI